MVKTLELMILAFIAFLIISKLLSVLGIIDDDDHQKQSKKIIEATVETDYSRFTDDTSLYPYMAKLESEIYGFNFEIFIEKVKKVFNILTTIDLQNTDSNLFSQIIDSDSITRICNRLEIYKDKDVKNPEISIYKVDFFGNRAMITLLFNTSNINELWTFKKDVNSSDPTWYLAEINQIEP